MAWTTHTRPFRIVSGAGKKEGECSGLRRSNGRYSVAFTPGQDVVAYTEFTRRSPLRIRPAALTPRGRCRVYTESLRTRLASATAHPARGRHQQPSVEAAQRRRVDRVVLQAASDAQPAQPGRRPGIIEHVLGHLAKAASGDPVARFDQVIRLRTYTKGSLLTEEATVFCRDTFGTPGWRHQYSAVDSRLFLSMISRPAAL